MNTPAIQPSRRLGCFTRLLLFFVLASITWLAIVAVFAPWSFFMGGRFHIIPMWQGWGRLHSSTAGDYVLFVTFSPRPGTRGIPHVSGNGILCTPRGERFNLNLGGDFEKHLGLDTNGKTAYLYMYNRSGLARQFGFNPDHRPRLDLRGKWNNPDLVLDDHGTLSHDFEPDGSLYTGHSPNRPASREVMQVTLREGIRGDFDTACAAAKVR